MKALFYTTLFATALVATAAFSHTAPPTADFPEGWDYPRGCCSGKDCAYVPHELYRETNEGYMFTIPVGQHPMVTDKPFVMLIPYNSHKIKPSPDGRMHLCMGPQSEYNHGVNSVYCVFEPVRGF